MATAQGKPERGASSGGKGGGAIAGPMARNVGVRDGPLSVQGKPTAGDSRSPGTPRRDVPAGAPSIAEEPWFGKLPPELRNAIRSEARRPPPRAYEERLRRYFESLE